MSDRAKDEGSARLPAAGSKEDQGKEDQEKAYREFNAALSQAIGDVVRLMAMHKSYGHMFLTDIQWMLIPPIVARQYKMISNNKGVTIGCVLWAEATDPTRERLKKGGWTLKPNEWQGGPNAIVMMVLAPTGMEETLLGEVKGRVFAKRRLEVARWMRGSREMELAEVEAPARQEKDK